MGNDSETPDPERLFGQRVRAERERRGWTRQQLAAAVAARGVALHPSAYGKIEGGPREVRLGEAVAIAAALGMTISQMLARTDPAGIGQELKQVEADLQRESDASDEALRRAAALRSRQRELIVALADLEGAR